MKPTAADLDKLLQRLRHACVQPADESPEATAKAWEILLECCVVEQLTREELERGYRTILRTSPTFRPKYGDWLKACRPPANEAVIADEGSTLFDMICDNANQRYGKYTSHGVFRERRLIEEAHGPAAGIAFGAAGGDDAFRHMSDEGRQFVRRKFCTAFAEARKEHGAPVMTPSSHQMRAALRPPQIAEERSEEAVESGEGRKKFEALMASFKNKDSGLKTITIDDKADEKPDGEPGSEPGEAA